MSQGKGPSLGSRRTKIELHRAAVRGWPAGPYKDIAKELIWLATINLNDLVTALNENARLRESRKP